MIFNGHQRSKTFISLQNTNSFFLYFSPCLSSSLCIKISLYDCVRGKLLDIATDSHLNIRVTRKWKIKYRGQHDKHVQMFGI